jgi:hypothetical protein
MTYASAAGSGPAKAKTTPRGLSVARGGRGVASSNPLALVTSTTLTGSTGAMQALSLRACTEADQRDDDLQPRVTASWQL